MLLAYEGVTGDDWGGFPRVLAAKSLLRLAPLLLIPALVPPGHSEDEPAVLLGLKGPIGPLAQRGQRSEDAAPDAPHASSLPQPPQPPPLREQPSRGSSLDPEAPAVQPHADPPMKPARSRALFAFTTSPVFASDDLSSQKSPLQ